MTRLLRRRKIRQEEFELAIERTFAIIKPDAVKRGLTGDILSRIHAAKFQIVAIKSLRLTKAKPKDFTPCIARGHFSAN